MEMMNGPKSGFTTSQQITNHLFVQVWRFPNDETRQTKLSYPTRVALKNKTVGNPAKTMESAWMITIVMDAS